MKRRYRRYFIMLELEDTNYKAYANKEVKGHAKVEIKNSQGILSIYCQNLKSSGNNNRYRWYLINTNTDGAPTVVEIGPMEIDEKGKGEMVCEFNTENVKGSMEQIDNFNVLVLAVQSKDDKGKLYTPLVGYMDKEKPNATSWRYALGKHLYIYVNDEYIKEKDEDIRETDKETSERPGAIQPYQFVDEIEEETTVDAEEDPGDKFEEDSQIEAEPGIEEEFGEEVEVEAEPEIEGEFEEEAEIEPELEIKVRFREEAEAESQIEIKDEFGKENKTKEVSKEMTEEMTEEVSKEMSEEISEEYVSPVATQDDSYQEQMQAYIENSLKGFIKVEPFINSLNHYSWWQIPSCPQTMYRAYMPFILYLDSLEEPTSHYISKMLQTTYIHKHHIFGICYDNDKRAKYYAYGIPGGNISLGQPFGTNINLAHWYPCNNVSTNLESHGYSILLIDSKTGDIVY